MQKRYTPLEKAQKKWRIRVFIPHLKDAYWLGVNYGLIDEARRLGISLSIYEAGGYDQLAVQRRQIEKRDYFKHVAPKPMVVDRDNICGWDTSTTLAPRGFRPIFSIIE